jgi:phosphatidylinositol alpha 1,6-mannosyltransferase
VRIVHISDFYPPRVGGVEQQVFQLAHAQAAAGHDVVVVTSTTDPAGSPGAPKGVRVHRLPANGSPHLGILAGPRALRTVSSEVTALAPDLVHAHSSVFSPFALIGAAAASRAGIPTVITVHSMWASLTAPYRVLFRRSRYAQLPIHWTAVSAIAAAQVQRALGPAHAVGVLPNGIDVSAWAPAAVAADASTHIVSVLRFAPRKRPLALLRTLRRARADIPADIPVRATLAGKGPLRALGVVYLRLHRMSWVELPGSLSRAEIHQLLSSASLFVSAARLESFGIAALEARCAGVPVIAIGGTGIEDFVAHNLEGAIANNDRALAAAISALAIPDGPRKVIADYVRDVPPRAGWAATLAAAATAYEQAALAIANR